MFRGTILVSTNAEGARLELIKEFPELRFIPGRYNMWSPIARTITYDARRISTNNGKIGLLHEIGHALLKHRTYKYDFELLKIEMDAWDVVRQLAPKFKLKVDENYIANCIQSYDEWLSKRATCPTCTNFSLQKDRNSFGCFACGSRWDVNWRKDRRVTRRLTFLRQSHFHS